MTSANTTGDALDSDIDAVTGNSPLTNLVSGESDQTVDAGIYRQGSIGDLVWTDTNGNGIKDPTETGVNGVTVLLKDALGNVLQTAVTTNSPTTGEAGYYNFTVDPGTYIVMVMAPTGTTISPNGPVNPTTGNTAPITVTSGSTNTTTDAGLYQAASIGNYVWEDTDKDGIQDGTELGVNGVTVQLKNAVGTILQTTTTSTNPTTGGAGYYQFSNLVPGDYIVTFVTPLNYKVTSANTTGDALDSDIDAVTGNSPLTNLVSGESDQTVDAGIYRQGSIGDLVWTDTNGNGIKDPTETGVNGVTVLLKDALGNVLQTAVTTNNPTTGEAGYYNFTVDPGTYIVMVMAPTGTTISPNGPVNPTTGNTAPITVTSGSTNTTTDAGLYQAASIGNYVWEDADKDGIQDGTELGVNGVTVQLKNAVGTILQTTTTSTNPTTGGAGYYQFSNLIPGDYIVTFVTL
ncbi:MAG: hypothetical protein IPH96_13180 [Saprospiraceae bacterium]|nr:hypothetical protein [Saprospiraceae bacterium]